MKVERKKLGVFVILRKETVQKATCFIQKENDEIIHDSSFITQEAKLFYEKLYVPHENDIVNFGMVI